MRWPPRRYTVQRPDEPDQTGCHEGPTIHFDRPVQEPPPVTSFVIRFPVWARRKPREANLS
jgi:hypothetical protein